MIVNKRVLFAIAALCSLSCGVLAQGVSSRPGLYRGMCDASAAVALDARTFVVADDESNSLFVYRTDRPGMPLRTIPWGIHLGIDPRDEHPESDIEGATVLDGRIYWITSHGRNKKGKWRPNRHRFFATTVTVVGDEVVAKPFGEAYHNLIVDLVADEKMQGLGLAAAVELGQKQVKDLAPKREGLNIEGLCATPDGKTLLIGFRNPRPGGKALLVPLLNPAAVLAEGATAEFGKPILLKLEVRVAAEPVGLGIRGIEYSRRQAAYLLIAGPHDTGKLFAVYSWSGPQGNPPKLLGDGTAAVRGPKSFNPEALIVYPDGDLDGDPDRGNQIQLLSDDGALRVKVASPAECLEGTYKEGECEAKHLIDRQRKTFRGIWVDSR